MPPKASLRFVSLFVPDLAQAARTYEALLGTPPTEGPSPAPAPHPFAAAGPVVFEVGGVALALYQADGKTTHAGDVGRSRRRLRRWLGRNRCGSGRERAAAARGLEDQKPGRAPASQPHDTWMRWVPHAPSVIHNNRGGASSTSMLGKRSPNTNSSHSF
jgi:hypothetical protein